MISSQQESEWWNEAKARQANLEWRGKSFKISVRILRELRLQKESNGMTQKKLAELMGVTPQYIHKIVKGKENLTLETIAKIEKALGIILTRIYKVTIKLNFSDPPFCVADLMRFSRGAFFDCQL